MSFVFFYTSLICHAATQKAQEMTHQINLINDRMFVQKPHLVWPKRSWLWMKNVSVSATFGHHDTLRIMEYLMSKNTCKHTFIWLVFKPWISQPSFPSDVSSTCACHVTFRGRCLTMEADENNRVVVPLPLCVGTEGDFAVFHAPESSF